MPVAHLSPVLLVLPSLPCALQERHASLLTRYAQCAAGQGRQPVRLEERDPLPVDLNEFVAMPGAEKSGCRFPGHSYEVGNLLSRQRVGDPPTGRMLPASRLRQIQQGLGQSPTDGEEAMLSDFFQQGPDFGAQLRNKMSSEAGLTLNQIEERLAGKHGNLASRESCATHGVRFLLEPGFVQNIASSGDHPDHLMLSRAVTDGELDRSLTQEMDKGDRGARMKYRFTRLIHMEHSLFSDKRPTVLSMTVLEQRGMLTLTELATSLFQCISGSHWGFPALRISGLIISSLE